MRSIFAAVSVLALAAACGPTEPAKPAALAPSETANADLQRMLIEAKPGDTIEIGEGTFEFTELPLGECTLTVSAGNKQLHSQKLLLVAGENPKLEIAAPAK